MTLQTVLCDQGLGYWALELNNWIEGKFNLVVMTFALHSPELIWQEKTAPSNEKQLLNDLAKSQEVIKQLEKEKAEAILPEKLQAIEEILADKNAENRRMNEELEKLKKDKLENRIDEAITSIASSLESASANLEKENIWSGKLRSYSSWLLIAALALVVGGIFIWFCVTPEDWMKNNPTALVLWHLGKLTPVLIVLGITIALLRHDAKVVQNIRALIEQKRRVEIATGLLKASQYIHQKPEERQKRVEETFHLLCTNLLVDSSADKKNEPNSETNKADANLNTDEILKIITRLSKSPEK